MIRKIKEFFNNIKEIKELMIKTRDLIIDDINLNRVKASFYDTIDDEFDSASEYINKYVYIHKKDKIIRSGECVNAGVIITNDKTFKYNVTCFLVVKSSSGREFTEVIADDKHVEIPDGIMEPTVGYRHRVGHGPTVGNRPVFTTERLY